MNTQTDRSTNTPMIRIAGLVLIGIAAVLLSTGLLYTHAAIQRASDALSVEGLPLGNDYPYASPLAVAGSRVELGATTMKRTPWCRAATASE